MKKVFIYVLITIGFAVAQIWYPYGPQTSRYQINDAVIEQSLDPYYLVYAVGYDVQSQEGVILRFNEPEWDRYSTPYDQDYIFTGITLGWPVGTHLVVVGYKRTPPNKFQGIILRGSESGWEDITGNLPPPYCNSPPPILDVALSGGWPGKLMITGGYGMILFTSDGGNTWYEPAYHPNPDPVKRLSDSYNRSRWCEGYPYQPTDVITVCADNSGIIARNTDETANPWNTLTVDEDYDIPEYSGTYYGKVLPLDVVENYCSMADGYVAKWYPSGWYARRIPDVPWLTQPPSLSKRWFWFHSCQHTHWSYPPNPIIHQYHVAGSDGCIMMHSNDISSLDFYWQKHPSDNPPNDSFYTINSLEHGLFGTPLEPYAHAYGSIGQSMLYEYTGEILGPCDEPSAAVPAQCENLDMFYDPILEGYYLHWDPPENSDSAKVGGYWICPTDEQGRWFVFNPAPIPRTWYFIYRPTGQWQDGRVCAMRREGTCGQWTPWVWRCTIDKMVARDATGWNNGRCLFYSQGKLWVFYSKDGNVYAAYTTDHGKHWANPFNLGPGIMQAAAINTDGDPIVICVENIHQPPQYVTARLWLSYIDLDEGITPRVLIKEETYQGGGYSRPSVTVDKNNHVHLVYERFSYELPNYWSLHYGEFPFPHPEQTTWKVIDYRGTQVPPHPLATATIGVDSENCPLILWNMPDIDSMKYTHRDSNGFWLNNTFVTFGVSPSLEMKGDAASVAFVHENDIWHMNGGKSGFSDPKRICQTYGYSKSPVIADNYIVWEEEDGDFSSLYYSYLRDNLTWASSSELFGYRYLFDRGPQVEWSKPYLCASWTQGTHPTTIVAFERKQIVTPAPHYAVDLGQELPSPITVERDGYIEYGAEPYMTVDFDSTMLVYHITGIEGSDKWRIKFMFYHEGDTKWKEKIRIDDGWTRNEWVYPHQLTEVEGIIPEAFVMDGEITITIEVTQGELAVLSGILLYREETGQGGGGPQSNEERQIPISLNCVPNPTRSHSLICYALPYRCDVKLSVYNSLGQLIRVLDKGNRNASIYNLNWDAKDSHGRKVASGIYFLRLETPETNKVEKLVILE